MLFTACGLGNSHATRAIAKWIEISAENHPPLTLSVEGAPRNAGSPLWSRLSSLLAAWKGRPTERERRVGTPIKVASPQFSTDATVSLRHARK